MGHAEKQAKSIKEDSIEKPVSPGRHRDQREGCGSGRRGHRHSHRPQEWMAA